MKKCYLEAKEEWSQVRENPKESEGADPKGAYAAEGSPEPKVAAPVEKVQTERKPQGLAAKEPSRPSQPQFRQPDVGGNQTAGDRQFANTWNLF